MSRQQHKAALFQRRIAWMIERSKRARETSRPRPLTIEQAKLIAQLAGVTDPKAVRRG